MPREMGAFPTDSAAKTTKYDPFRDTNARKLMVSVLRI